MTISLREFRFPQGMVTVITVILLLTPFWDASARIPQTKKRPRVVVRKPSAPTGSIDSVERAMNSICTQRGRDPQATVPIDEMATQQVLPLTHPQVIAARKRAESLLPVAKRLVPFALSHIAAMNDLKPLSLRWIITRVQAVKTIKTEVEERDNSAWRSSEPDAIVFGTIFLAGLRSDEAIIAVLAHELTHAVNGTDQALQPVFTHIGTKAARIGSPVSVSAAAELTCELVGIEVLRDYVSQTSKSGPTAQRLIRAFEKDCVRKDLADENHLSPRQTMRLLLKLEPDVSTAIVGVVKGNQSQKSKRAYSRRSK